MIWRRIELRGVQALCPLVLAMSLAGCPGGGNTSSGGSTIVAAACPATQTQAMPPAPAPGMPVGPLALGLDVVVTGLSFPVFMTAAPNDATRLFIVERNGVIKIFDVATQQVLPTPFLNLTGQISITGEQGLLGLAFHPDYQNNGFFYIYVSNAEGHSEIRRYQDSAGDANQADPASATLVITISQLLPNGLQFSNHQAGWLGFGMDGFLYAALGDGGSGGDPTNRAQSLDTLLGKMLRLNIDSDAFPQDATRNYAIPADNPCVGQAGALGEIWSMGLRNPWRPSFDRGTGDLYIADVGQNAREEVNVSTVANGAGRGSNYGWKIMEGTLCFSPSSGCNMAGLVQPAVDYPHNASGGCSITGGYVYRGAAIAGLQGTYFYADYCQGFVRSFRLNGGMVTEHTGWPALDTNPENITSFGEDAAGELYIVTQQGRILRIVQN